MGLAAAARFSLMLLDDGSVLLWGTPPSSVAGAEGTPTEVALPVVLPANAVAVAAGRDHALVLLVNGRVYGLGRDVEGQLNGAVRPMGCRATTGLGTTGFTGSGPTASIRLGSG